MPKPISFETIDDLEMLWHDLREISNLSRLARYSRYNQLPSVKEKLLQLRQVHDEALACVEKALVEARTNLIHEFADLSEAEDEHISKFDGRLRKLTDLLQRECTSAQNTLDACLADPSDPMADFEIDVRIHYIAGEHVRGYRENSDNHLTFREYPMRRRSPMEPCILSGEYPDSSEPNRRNRSHCWLFHDLTEHCYGVTQPSIPAQKINQIGSIWAEVVLRRQYDLDARTGNWVRL